MAGCGVLQVDPAGVDFGARVAVDVLAAPFAGRGGDPDVGGVAAVAVGVDRALAAGPSVCGQACLRGVSSVVRPRTHQAS